MAGTGPPADHPPPDSGRYEPIYSGSCTDPRHRPMGAAARQRSTCAASSASRSGRRGRRPGAGAGGHRPPHRRRGRARPGPAGRGPGHRRGAARPAGGAPPRLAEPDLEFRAFCARRGCPPRQPRNWSGPGTPGRPSGTSAARPASGRATPTTRSGHADHPPVVPAFRELDAVAVLTARLLPAPVDGTRFLPKVAGDSVISAEGPPKEGLSPCYQNVTGG